MRLPHRRRETLVIAAVTACYGAIVAFAVGDALQDAATPRGGAVVEARAPDPGSTAAAARSEGGGPFTAGADVRSVEASGRPARASADAEPGPSGTVGDAGSSGPVAGTAAATAQGITADAITIGFEASANLQAGFAALGASGTPPEERKVIEAVVRWVNDHGGIAGRRVVPVIHEVDRTQGSFDAQEEAACADFTEDHRVFAAASTPVSGNDALVACMAKKGVPLVENNLFPYDGPYFERYAGLLYQPSRLEAARAFAAYTDGLAAAGWYDKATIGLLRLDAPVFQRLADGVVKPGMARHGAKVAEEVVLSTPASVADLGALNAQFGNAIVRFRSRGVDHLSILEVQGAVSFFFMKEADSQGWHPIYGLHSYNIPATQAQQQGASQLHGSVGVGWLPSVDTYGPEQPKSAAVDRCLAIMRDAGIPLDYLTYSFYTHPQCDALFFLKAALEAAPDLSHAGFRAGVERLGDQWQAASNLTTRLGPGRPFGAASYRTFAYDDGCACFAYTAKGAGTVP